MILLNEPADIIWLTDVHLKNVMLPERWIGFKAALLQGREDYPVSIDLYLSADPMFMDPYLRLTRAPRNPEEWLMLVVTP